MRIVLLLVLLLAVLAPTVVSADVITPGRRGPTADEIRRRREAWDRGLPRPGTERPVPAQVPSHPNLVPDDDDGLGDDDNDFFYYLVAGAGLLALYGFGAFGTMRRTVRTSH